MSHRAGMATDLDLRHFRYFVTVAEELHFARAAQRIGIRPSPLSKAITQLERRLKLRLFHRNRRRTQLTEAGAALLPQAKILLAQAERLQQTIAALSSE